MVSRSIVSWCGLALLAAVPGALAARPAPAATQRPAAALEKLPLSFEANQGQTDASVRFLSRGDGYALFLNPSEAVLSLSHRGEAASVLRMQLLGANAQAKSEGMEPQAGKTHYLLGERGAWHRNVPSYGRVAFDSVLPGIDVVYYGRQRQLEYDFRVAAGADPSAIHLRFDGAESVRTGDRGELLLGLGGREVRFQAPVAYQETAKGRKPVTSRYEVSPKGDVRFALGAYDRKLPLVIDPLLVYSSFFGGAGFDAGTGIAIDQFGATYICGFTASTDFPSAAPAQRTAAGGGDAFITKLNAAGTAPLFSTYLGGSGRDAAAGIAIDVNGNAYITGVTESTDFPIVGGPQAASGGGSDAFLAKLSADGSTVVYSTYLGGSGNDSGSGVAVDGDGAAYITGYTGSADFPTTDGALRRNYGGNNDAFVAKVDPTGTQVVYSTFLGGRGGDFGNGIAVDSNGQACVVGNTASGSALGTGDPLDFPATAGALLGTFQGGDAGDAFVAKLTPDGSGLVFATYLGGSGSDTALAVALDRDGNAYVAGSTDSEDLVGTGSAIQPVQGTFGGGDKDGFVAKVSADGASLIYLTYLGGSGLDVARGVAVDNSDVPRVYVVGETASSNFPTRDPLQRALQGEADIFVAKLHETASGQQGGTLVLDYATFLGGSGQEQAGGIAVDGAGSVVITGRTESSDFPVWQQYGKAGKGKKRSADAFVARLFDSASAPGGTLAVTSQVKFAQIKVGLTQTKTLVIRNASTSSAMTLRLELPGDPFSLPNGLLSLVVPPGGSLAVPIKFAPTASVVSTSTLTLHTSDPNQSVVNVRLIGTGHVPGQHTP